jgi:phage gp36-like protein
MAYISNSDLQTRLGPAVYVQLADDDGDGSADAAVVDEVRLAAEGELNSYLSVRHAVPVDLSAHPELAGLLRGAALDLAEYRLRLRRPPVPEDIRRRRDQTVDWLVLMAEGAVALPAVTVPGAKGLTVAVSGADRVFRRSEMESV